MSKMVLTVGIAALLVAAAPAQASSHGIRGYCGLHFGKLVNRNSGGSVYVARIGPRQYHTGGDMRCRGHYLAQTNSTNGLPGVTEWRPFSLPSFRKFFYAELAFDTSLVAQGCRGVALTLSETIATEGGAVPGLALSGAGCIYGVYQLGQNLPNTHSEPNMRLVHRLPRGRTS